MKNKIILFAAGAALLITSVLTFRNVNRTNDSMDDLFRANVEALARNEAGFIECFKNMKSDPCEEAIYCGTCSKMPGRGSKKSVCYK